jgi:acyl-CoA synthetase (AMP-forming)/AMP-acid ligase II
LSYAHATSNIPLLTTTIDDQFRKTVERFPDRELFVFKQQGIRRSYSQVYNDAMNLAKGLICLGLKHGDRIGIWGPNYYEWTVTQFAAASAGLILVNLNPAYEANELKYVMRQVGVKALVTPQAFRYSDYYG